jgi:rhamnose utilization protein RhaD (predicted bifunctional aldolase and dehydrogenase)
MGFSCAWLAGFFRGVAKIESIARLGVLIPDHVVHMLDVSAKVREQGKLDVRDALKSVVQLREHRLAVLVENVIAPHQSLHVALMLVGKLGKLSFKIGYLGRQSGYLRIVVCHGVILHQ